MVTGSYWGGWPGAWGCRGRGLEFGWALMVSCAASFVGGLELISWGCFGWVRGASGLGGAACTSLWWRWPFRSYGALKAQKTADITTCQQFLAVSGL